MSISTILIIVQTFLGLFVAILGIILALMIIRHDPSYSLNRSFAIGLVCIGLAMFFFSSSNIPYLVFGEQSSNTGIIILSMQLFLTFFSIAITSFLFASYILLYGSPYAFSYRTYPYIIIYLGSSIIVTWFTQSIIPLDLQGDIKVGFFVEIIFFPLTVVVYLMIMYFFKEVYEQTEGDVKYQLQMFLLGWILAGVAMLLAALSNLLPGGRVLDIAAPIVVSVTLNVIFQGFRPIKRSL